MTRPLAIIVDPDASFRARIEDALARAGLAPLGAASVDEANELLRTRTVDVILAADGAWLASRATGEDAPLTVRIFAAVDALEEGADEAFRAGAADAVPRDQDDAAWHRTLARAAAAAERRARETRLLDRTRRAEGFAGLVGRSAALEELRERLQRLAPLHESVWIEGEAGAGKRWCARTLHRWMNRAPRSPFIVLEASDLEGPGWESRWLSCGEEGIPRTVYLSDPATFPVATLQRLNAALSSLDPRVRVVSGSTVRLDQATEEGRLPPALGARLAAVRLVVPPLRERPDDVGPLAVSFLEEISALNRTPQQRLSADALDRLEGYAWPGNVRELRHAVEHASILATDEIDLPHLPRGIRDERERASQSVATLDLERPFRDVKRDVVSAFEERYLAALMERQRGNVTAAAREAGMLRSALQRLLRKHGIRSAEFRRVSARARMAAKKHPRTAGRD